MSITEKLIKRVSQLPARQKEEVLNFVEYLHQKGNGGRRKAPGKGMQDNADDIALAEAGLKLAAEVWPEDDFSDWPGYEKGEGRKG